MLKNGDVSDSAADEADVMPSGLLRGTALAGLTAPIRREFAFATGRAEFGLAAG